MRRHFIPLIKSVRPELYSTIFSHQFIFSRYSTVAAPAATECLPAHEILGSDEFLLQLKEDLEQSQALEVRCKSQFRSRKILECLKKPDNVFQDPLLNQKYINLLSKINDVFIEDCEVWQAYLNCRETFNKGDNLNVFIPLKVFEVLIESFSASREDNDKLLILLKDKLMSGYEISNEECLSYLKILFDSENSGTLDFFKIWISSGNKADISIINEMLKYFRVLGDYKSCKQLFQTISEGGLIPDCISYIHLIDITLSRADYIGARKLFKDMVSTNTEIGIAALNTLLGKFSYNKDWIGTRQVLEAGMKRNLKPQLSGLTSLLRASMKNFILSKNRFHTSTLGKYNELALIKLMYNGLLTSQLPLDKIALSVFVNWYVHLEDLGAAYSVLKDMERLGFSPDNWEYTIIIRGHRYNKEWSEILSLYYVLKEKKLKMNEFTYNSFIKAFFHLRGRDPQLLLDILNQGILAPTSIIYDLCIKLFCRKNQFSKAFQVYETLLQSNFKPTIFTLTHFFEKVCFLSENLNGNFKDSDTRNSLLEILKRLFVDSTKNTLPIDLALYNMMIKSFAFLKDVDQVQVVYNQLYEKGFVPNNRTLKPIYANMIRGLSIGFVYQKIISELNLNHATVYYHSYIQGLVFSRKTALALELYYKINKYVADRKIRGLSNTNTIPELNAAIFVTLIQGCILEHDFDSVLSILDDMRRREIKLSSFLYHRIHVRLTFARGYKVQKAIAFLKKNFSDTLDVGVSELQEWDSDINSQSQSDCFSQFKRLSIDYYNILIQYYDCSHTQEQKQDENLLK